MTLRLLLGTVTAFAFHLIFGWAWSIGGGIVAGVLGRKRGWLAGGIAVGLSWGLFLAHAFIVAAAPTQRLLDIIGGFLEVFLACWFLRLPCCLECCSG